MKEKAVAAAAKAGLEAAAKVKAKREARERLEEKKAVAARRLEEKKAVAARRLEEKKAVAARRLEEKKAVAAREAERKAGMAAEAKVHAAGTWDSITCILSHSGSGEFYKVQKSAVYCHYHPDFCELYCKQNPSRIKATETWEDWRRRLEAEPVPPSTYLQRREPMPATTGVLKGGMARDLGGWAGWKHGLVGMAPQATVAEREHPVATSVHDLGNPAATV